MSKAQKAIEQHEKAIEEIKNNQFTQDLIDVLSDKKHTDEELAVVCSAFAKNYYKRWRQDNLVKARAERKSVQKVQKGRPKKEEKEKTDLDKMMEEDQQQ